MKSAALKYGRPKMFNFDNGSPYKNKQMELLAACLGCAIHYDQPYTPTQKAKIERWFRTMKDPWMAALDVRQFHTLDELRGNLMAYVQSYNQSQHSSLKGKSPQDRFFSEPECIRRLPDGEADRSFAKQRICLRYTPNRKEIFIVGQDGGLTPICLLNKQENASIRREKVHLSGVRDDG